MTYHNATKLLKNAPKTTGKKYDFERIKALCNQLGNPHKLMNYIRLAGSNGKTVCGEMLCAALKSAGYKIGYLSMPLCDDARQNIKIGNEIISIDLFSELCSETVAAISAVKAYATEQLSAEDSSVGTATLSELGELIPTQNEILLSVALLAFKKEKCDLCIIECEHNGEDPSKFLPPASSVVICGTIPSGDRKEITRIRSYIGKGIREIVSVPQNSEAFKVIYDTCFEAGCRLTVPQKSELSIEKSTLGGTVFTYKGLKYSLGLCGKFQISNATVVIESLKMLERAGFKIPYESVNSAFSRLKISCKFEVLSMMPFIIADSTHTPVAIETISDSLLDFQAVTGKDIYLCLPYGSIADNFIAALKKRDFNIAGVVLMTNDTDSEIPADEYYLAATPKAAAKKSLEILKKDSLLFISGTHNFSNQLRREILSMLGF